MAKVVAIIPAHNERSTVADVVTRAIKHVDRVLVVDDGSSDDTAQVAATAGAEVLSLNPNRGKGGALRAGLERAVALGAEIIVTLDADGEHNPDEIPLLTAAAARADVVLGARRIFRSGTRKALNGVALFWFQLIDPNIRDTICGFRAFRREALPALSSHANGFAYEHEILLQAIAAGLRVETVDITTVPREFSHVNAKEIVRANNHFTAWVLQHHRELHMPQSRKALLFAGCVIGRTIGVPMQAAIDLKRSRG